MHPSTFFRHCPRCAVAAAPPAQGAPFDCPACGFRYYFNPAVAVAAFIVRGDGEVLLIRRAKEPAKDRLAPPGGFIDAGETAEHAVEREIAEEVGLVLRGVRFLCSSPNAYEFRGVTYPVLDLFFTARAADTAAVRDPEEVAAAGWFAPEAVREDDLAFPSMRAAWRVFRASARTPVAP